MSPCLEPEDRTYTRVYKEQTPDILKAFTEFDGAVFASEVREIPLKYRELIALGVALTTQCVYCIDAHSNNAVKAGATQGELAEAAWVAAALRAGASYAHGRVAFKLTDPTHPRQPRPGGLEVPPHRQLPAQRRPAHQPRADLAMACPTGVLARPVRLSERRGGGQRPALSHQELRMREVGHADKAVNDRYTPAGVGE